MFDLDFLKKLELLDGSIKVYYSQDFKEGAINIQSILDGMGDYYNKLLQCNPKLNILHLSKKDYEIGFDMPYGMPFVFGSLEEWIINIPAEEGVIVDLLKSDYDNLPAETTDIISKELFDQSTNRFVSLIGFHEIGHTYSYTLGLGEICHWLSEFMATYFAYGFLKDKHPEEAQLWDNVNAVTLATSRELTYKTLDDFNHNYSKIASQSPGDYTYYQARFSSHIKTIHDRYGISFVEALISRVASHKLTDEEIERILIDIAPEFEEWLNDF